MGSIAAFLTASCCSPTYFVISSDVNADKLVDLVVGEENGDVYVLLNSREQMEDTQSGSIIAPPDYERENNRKEELPIKTKGYRRLRVTSLREGLLALGVYDINQDGLEDIITVDKQKRVRLLYNQGNGKFVDKK